LAGQHQAPQQPLPPLVSQQLPPQQQSQPQLQPQQQSQPKTQAQYQQPPQQAQSETWAQQQQPQQQSQPETRAQEQQQPQPETRAQEQQPPQPETRAQEQQPQPGAESPDGPPPAWLREVEVAAASCLTQVAASTPLVQPSGAAAAWLPAAGGGVVAGKALEAVESFWCAASSHAVWASALHAALLAATATGESGSRREGCAVVGEAAPQQGGNGTGGVLARLDAVPGAQQLLGASLAEAAGRALQGREGEGG
jgi:hypothetical protein